MAINRRLENANCKGIYAIVNMIDGKIYIGSASLLRKRRNLHLLMLRRGNHDNVYLQRAWNKYGEINFEFFILERCDELLVREQYFMDSLNPEYNMLKIAYRTTGIKRRPETCKKISEALSGRQLSNEHRKAISYAKKGITCTSGKRITPIKQYTLNGEFMMEYPSIADAARVTKGNAKAIQECLSGRNKTSNNFKWGY